MRDFLKYDVNSDVPIRVVNCLALPLVLLWIFVCALFLRGIIAKKRLVPNGPRWTLGLAVFCVRHHFGWRLAFGCTKMQAEFFYFQGYHLLKEFFSKYPQIVSL